jgi:hypothetical protein
MPTPQDYQTARALALKTLAGLDMAFCCQKAGAHLETLSTNTNKVSIPYLMKTYHLMVGKDRIAFDEDAQEIKLPDQVLLLHYLITATGAPVNETWITFRQVPSGPFYYPSFVKRAIAPLVHCFGQDPDGLWSIAENLGKRTDGPGDVALKVTALPRVPVVLSLWRGDDEFPAEGNVYFDSTVTSYLPTEDIAYLAGSVVYTVIGLFRSMQ